MGRLLVIASTLAIAACGGGGGPGGDALDDLPEATLGDDPDAARRWAQLGSAPQIYMAGVSMVTVADLAIEFDGTCPTKSGTETDLEYRGGCTTADGDTWVGTATVEQSTTGDVTIHYDGFGMTGSDDCGDAAVPTSVVVNGTMLVSTGPLSSFDVDLSITGDIVDEITCTTRAATYGIDYHGAIASPGESSLGATEWSGSGRVGSSIDGVADVETEGERIDDDVCEDEAIAGTTRIMAGGRTIAITYDGQTDCDVEATVQWSFDGEARGEVSGVACSAGHSSSGVLVLLAVLFGLRRRRIR